MNLGLKILLALFVVSLALAPYVHLSDLRIDSIVYAVFLLNGVVLGVMALIRALRNRSKFLAFILVFLVIMSMSYRCFFSGSFRKETLVSKVETDDNIYSLTEIGPKEDREYALWKQNKNFRFLRFREHEYEATTGSTYMLLREKGKEVYLIHGKKGAQKLELETKLDQIL
ncbi:hypothetical protein [Fulvivirga ligni]|uniref:hypothetical protein n=1 Tax=Fulvivirga ligni TaxID=2904246 RepID=UPI001F2F7FA0|nr:hypothetical protein [Fulvivirga ligni]UII20301.1 hypothetical protein LVD16_20880 [Fulvivirga ligni]